MASVVALLLPVLGAQAQGLDDADYNRPLEKSQRHTRILYRPSKKTAGEQLEHAKKLHAEGKLIRAGRQYLALVTRWPRSREAFIGQLRYAELLEERGKHETAFDEYQYLLDHYPSSAPYTDVLDRQFRIANLIMTTKSRFLGIIPTKAHLERALPLFEKVVRNGPTWERTPEAQFNVGWIQEQLGEYELAISAYETAKQRYPSTSFASDSDARIGHCLYVLARKSRREERSSHVARTHLMQFIRRHPDHDTVPTAKKELAEVTERLADMHYKRALFYDKNGKHPKAALIAYTDFLNKFPETQAAEIARARVSALRKQAEAQ